jgi:hypothetical protein
MTKQVKFTIKQGTGQIQVETLGTSGPKCVNDLEEIKVAIGGAQLGEDQKTGDYWKGPDPAPNFQFGNK